MNTKPIIIGVSGSSGIIYGIRFLQVLRSLGVNTHLVVSEAGQLTRAFESDVSLPELKALATVYHPCKDVAASISSGSFQTQGMIVAPCSMRTLAEIAHGTGQNLLTRSADVVLKERRRLVLLTRETPLHLGHLNNMVQVTQMGGIIFPPVPAFYHRPKTLEDVVDDHVGRVLDLFGIEHELGQRWQGELS